MNNKIMQPVTQNLNRLPFLQAQILQKIFFDMYVGKQINLSELSDLTDYSANSKILKDAIVSLKQKGYLTGEIGSLSIPCSVKEMLVSFVGSSNLTNKEYSNTLLDFCNNASNSDTLFQREYSKSELNKLGVVHK